MMTTDVPGRPYLFVITRRRAPARWHALCASLSRPSHSVNATSDANDIALLERLAQARHELAAQIAKRIVGQSAIVDDLVAALLAGGHVVLIGVPGLAKTLLVQTVARALDLTNTR